MNSLAHFQGERNPVVKKTAVSKGLTWFTIIRGTLGYKGDPYNIRVFQNSIDNRLHEKMKDANQNN